MIPCCVVPCCCVALCSVEALICIVRQLCCATALCCVVLCCAVLCCVVLCCVVLCCVVLCCALLISCVVSCCDRCAWKRTRAHLRCISRVGKLCSDVQHKPFHDVNLFVPNFHLSRSTRNNIYSTKPHLLTSQPL